MMGNLLLGLNVDPRAERIATAFQLASLADEHGLDFVSVMDHPEQPRFLESWTLLVALAMRTHRVAVMPNVATIPLRPPAMLAKAASSLALLTQGPASIRRNYNVMGAIDPQAATQDGELLVGGVDVWVEALGRYQRELGFDSFVFWPVRGDELAQSRLFATEVVPRLRELARPAPGRG